MENTVLTARENRRHGCAARFLLVHRESNVETRCAGGVHLFKHSVFNLHMPNTDVVSTEATYILPLFVGSGNTRAGGAGGLFIAPAGDNCAGKYAAWQADTHARETQQL